VNVGELALTCFAYGAMAYDDSLSQLERRVGGKTDLADPEHRQALLHWLNQWQCRRFSLAYHGLASASLFDWHLEFAAALPPERDHLWEVPEATLEDYAAMFDALAKKTAGYRGPGLAPAAAAGAAGGPSEAAPLSRRTTVSFGPTAAAKILFVLRSKVFVVWDEPLRAGMHYGGSGRSYVDFLLRLREELLELQETCRAFGMESTDLPPALGRPLSTPAQLLGEYYLATVTCGTVAPTRQQVARWLEWYTPPNPEQPTLIVTPAGSAAPAGGVASAAGGGPGAKPATADGRGLVPPPPEPSPRQ
jgi:hypothetical protein